MNHRIEITEQGREWDESGQKYRGH